MCKESARGCGWSSVTEWDESNPVWAEEEGDIASAALHSLISDYS